MVTTKTVLGKVQHNDGDFAEIETYGIDGIETGLILETIQVDRRDTGDGIEQFRRAFRVGELVDITTILVANPSTKTAKDLDDLSRAGDEIQHQFELGEI